VADDVVEHGPGGHAAQLSLVRLDQGAAKCGRLFEMANNDYIRERFRDLGQSYLTRAKSELEYAKQDETPKQSKP
jgi:hypothetical protein